MDSCVRYITEFTFVAICHAQSSGEMSASLRLNFPAPAMRVFQLQRTIGRIRSSEIHMGQLSNRVCQHSRWLLQICTVKLMLICQKRNCI